ncbi:MAG: DUF3786 domain-containing protein [Thermoleophilia bacterium]|nr:DUF3786 domain-containing protein [Thermoleophilia bacterium]
MPTNEEKHKETYEAAEAAVRAADPAEIAARTGATWLLQEGAGVPGVTGVLRIPALGDRAALAWPSLEFTAESPLLRTFPWRLICLHYLVVATGRPPGTDWVSYREIPDGLFYANTVTREVEQPLAALYGTRPDAFLAAGGPLGATPADVADAALLVRPLPHVAVLFALWVEDEEFPAKVKVLYDRTGTADLPLQDLRILADLLGGALRRGNPG